MAQWISAIAAVVALIISAMAAHINVKLRLALSEFQNTFMERLNGRYIRRPDNEDDYPASRREVESLSRSVRAIQEMLTRK